LPEPKAEKSEKRDVVLNRVIPEAPHGLKWAEDLKARYLSGEKLLIVQCNSASEALNEVWANGKCEPK
jgi:hypothetical protein